MSVQLGNPTLFTLPFRDYDENGNDLGAIPLDDMLYRPVKLVLKKANLNDTITVEEADLTINTTTGVVSWQAPANTLDVYGTWWMQGHAGEWKSRKIVFVVHPNIM